MMFYFYLETRALSRRRMAELSQNGFIVPIDIMRKVFGEKVKRLLEKLTVTYRPKIGPPTIVKMYRIANGCIYLPRTSMRALSRLINIRISMPPLIRINVVLGIELYRNQQIVIDRLRGIFTPERIADGTACALLNMRAGTGKTFMAAGLIVQLGLRTLYIVHKCILRKQAVDDFRACYPDNPDIVGAWPEVDPSHSITVIVINSALKRDAEFFNQYSFIIFDEVHEYCSSIRRNIFHHHAPAMLGMSATTEDRTDGFDIIAHRELAFDGIVRAASLPDYVVDEIAFECHARVINYYGPPEHTCTLTHEATGLIFTPYMHKQYLRDPYRLKLVVDELVRIYDWRGPTGQMHCIYIFAEEIELLRIGMNALQAALNARNRDDIDIIVPELGLELFIGGLKDAQIKNAIARGRVYCSTYGYSGTGVSITKMTAILFLTPRKAKMLQILARILRGGSDITIPRIVIDINDVNTCLTRQFGQRLLAYNHYGFDIVREKIKYTDIKIEQ